ncbi:MAG: sensor hybrid histidine kinase [Gammaproteobacteria bacterium]|nr:sensor hybrid histidine kinase [Gammaproteobacteria bacterium]
MKADRQWGKISPPMLIGISLILALAILVFDLSMPLGVAAGTSYIALVLLGYFAPWWYYIYLMAGFATLLTIIGYYASPDGGIPWVVLTNRGLTLFAIWATAIIGAYIQQKEAKFNAAINSASDGIISINTLGIIESFNKGAETIFGYSTEEVMGKNVSMLMPSPHRERHNDYISQYLMTKEAKIIGKTIELKAQRKDRTIFPIELTVTESQYAGKFTFIGIIRDISERIHAAEQLNKLSRAVKQSPVSIIITDAQGNIEYVNPKFTQVTGYEYDEIIGQSPRILKSGETPPEEYKRLWDTITAGGQWRGMLHNVKKNGELFWESATISPIRNMDGEITHYLAVKEDITERLETENQLVHALKVEAAGQLTSGIVHDFNNLLTIITGNLQLLLEGIGRRGNKEVKEILADAISASLDSGELIQRLLVLSHKEKLLTQEIDINAVITDNVRFLDRMLGQFINVNIDLNSDIQAVIADQNQLESALLNLAVNAQDAMPDGGNLTIKTSRIIIGPDTSAGNKELTPGNYVIITVSDTGMGMDQEVIDRACEPFFTTKGAGKGSGLGLSMVHSFAKQSGGQLHISSTPGTGTEITLLLPETARKIDDRKTESIAIPIPEGTETILLVEDMEQVRGFAVRGLKSLGYRVLEAGDANTAMRIIREEIAIDLLFTDIVIPGELNGRKLAEWATGTRPGLRAALTTGQHLDNRDTMPGTEFALLKKPYSFEHLACFIRSQLDKSK